MNPIAATGPSSSAPGDSAARSTPTTSRGTPEIGIGRRTLARGIAASMLLPLVGRANAMDIARSHAIAVLGKPKLPPDFPYFPYVNPNAPKGGQVTLASVGTFDSFNPFILRGTAEGATVAPWIILPGGAGSGSSVGHVWESLLISSADEGAVGYGHLAGVIELPPDRMWVAFELRPEAKFSDGKPVTAADVAWTYQTLLAQGRPSFRIQFADVKDVTVEHANRVVFHFISDFNRQLPLILGGLPVLPSHWFKGRDFSKPLADAPIGSGPYRIASFELGRNVTYERDPSWWAVKQPTGIGTNNFDKVRVEYFRDSTVAMEAFKAGSIDVRSENISKNWATAYNFPAVAKGLVIRGDFRHHLPTGMQGFAMNTRRPVFKDVHVRQAMGYAFDFEWTNKNLFYGAYTRTTSYFSDSGLASSGIPQGDELALLEKYRSGLPPELFSQPFALPVTDGSGNDLPQLKTALGLLEQAGWTVKQRKLVDASGQQMAFTILVDDPSLERIMLPYSRNVTKLGIDVQVRTVDPAQFQHLMDNFDFDMTFMIYPESAVPGQELRDYWSCAASMAQGSSNVCGICDPAVDDLIEKVIAATDKPSLQAAARALDRILLWRWYMVPNWDNLVYHVAYWNRFGHPDKPIREGFNFDSWWVDTAKAAATDAARRG
ncbi:MAG TPA: extracellular solute-binding protein [Acetobacteraceae bacterium]|jgi:microcin C transport system substrate-binding protein